MRSFPYAWYVDRIFNKNDSKTSLALCDYLRKDKKLDWSDYNTEALEAFSTLNRDLVSPPVLVSSQLRSSNMVDTDASAYALEAVFHQQ